MNFDKNLLDYLCELAKLSLKEDEKEEILESLKELVEEFSIISDVEDAKSNFQDIRKLSLREDLVVHCKNVDYIRNNFPSTEEGLLKAPNVIDEE